MAGSFNNYLNDVVLDSGFGNQAFPSNANLYIALYTVAPTISGGGTEVTGGSYVRLQVANDLVTWTPSSGGVKINAVDFDFVQATADWGTVVAAAILDAASGGNFLCYGTLAVPKVVSNLDTLHILSGNFTITLSA